MMQPSIDNPNDDLAAYMEQLGHKAREAAATLRLATSEQKAQALKNMALEVRSAAEDILTANVEDMRKAELKGTSGSFLDRLKLDSERIEAMAVGLEDIAALNDPVGSIDDAWMQPNGLKFSKVRVPIGVIGMIYESRPNVTADAGALCVKSGNACILRGGSEGANSSRAIHQAIIKGLMSVDLPAAAIQLIATTNRTAVGHLLGGLNGNIDLIIPRGGKSLISRVQSDARVPVLAHLEGLCHTYIHEGADLDKAEAIILNAKLRRTGVCGSTETMLLDKNIAAHALPRLANALLENGCELRGDKASQLLHSAIKPAADNDYFTEHLAPILNIRIVEDIDAAMTHISYYGSGHTDSIVTEDKSAAARFLKDVDSSICIHNASTQFADGGQFGFGAEIGIATGRLHARGPVGAQHLTTYKYCVEGDGQVRPL